MHDSYVPSIFICSAISTLKCKSPDTPAHLPRRDLDFPLIRQFWQFLKTYTITNYIYRVQDAVLFKALY